MSQLTTLSFAIIWVFTLLAGFLIGFIYAEYKREFGQLHKSFKN